MTTNVASRANLKSLLDYIDYVCYNKYLASHILLNPDKGTKILTVLVIGICSSVLR